MKNEKLLKGIIAVLVLIGVLVVPLFLDHSAKRIVQVAIIVILIPIVVVLVRLQRKNSDI
jgi:hypothetical protein